MEARPTSTAPIAYAPPPPRHRRWLRRAVLPVLAAALLASAFWWGPPTWYRARLSYYERRCAAYAVPAEMIVYTNDPADVKRLTATPAGYQPGPGGAGSVFLVPPAWSKFYGLLSPPGFRSRGTVFLHERRTPGGRRLLVAVDYLGRGFHDAGNFFLDVSEFHIRAFESGGPFALPVEVQSDQAPLSLYTSGGVQAPLRLRAGQPDPDDPTHFTIRWELPGSDAAGVIDGWVRDRGVALERR